MFIIHNGSPKNMKLIIYGCTQQPIKIVSRLRRITKQDIEIMGFLDSDKSKQGSNYMGFPVLGTLEQVKEWKDQAMFCNCVTRTTEDRKSITDGILSQGGNLFSLIDPEVDLELVKVGNGVYIQEAVYIQAGCEIGDNVSIHMGSMLGHGCKIGNDSMLTFAVNISGGVQIGEGVAVYTGANLVGNIKIGDWSIIGAGSTVLNDIPNWVLALGTPAKVIKSIKRGHGLH